MAIMTIAIGLVISAVAKVRSAAERLACASNLRQIGIGVHHYAVTNHEHFPAGCDYPNSQRNRVHIYYAGVSWQTSILHFVERGELALAARSAYNADPRGRSADLHLPVARNVVAVYNCPADGRKFGTWGYAGDQFALTGYVGVKGTGVRTSDGIFPVAKATKMTTVTDGTSNTVMVGERPPGPSGFPGSWYSMNAGCLCPATHVLHVGVNNHVTEGVNCSLSYEPLRPGQIESGCDSYHFWSVHPGGANFAFADGSVRFLRYSANDVLPALATRAGGEAVEIPD